MGCRFEMLPRYKLKIAHFLSGELLQKAREVDAAKEHMQRTINALEGTRGSHFKEERDKEGRVNLGHPLHGMPEGSILDDLKNPQAAAAFGPQAAKDALDLATSARDTAIQSMANPNVTLDEIKRSGTAVSALLQSAIDRISS